MLKMLRLLLCGETPCRALCFEHPGLALRLWFSPIAGCPLRLVGATINERVRIQETQKRGAYR